MFGKHAVVLTLTLVAAAVTAVVAWAGPQFSGWAHGDAGRPGRCERGEYPGTGWLSDPVAGRAQPVHRVEPAGQRRARSLGRPTRKHRRALGQPGQPERRTGSRPQHQRRRVLPDARARQRAFLRPQAELVRPRRHLLHALQPGPRLERAERLACAPEGPNTALDEMGPSYVEAGGGARLYYSSSRSAAQGGAVPGDIFVSRMGSRRDLRPRRVGRRAERSDGQRHPAEREEGRPRGRVLLEPLRRQGSQDIWVATRENGGDAWSQPVNLGTNINTTASESRPSLSWDGETLYFGRAPAAGGPGDVYITTRSKTSSP